MILQFESQISATATEKEKPKRIQVAARMSKDSAVTRTMLPKRDESP